MKVRIGFVLLLVTVRSVIGLVAAEKVKIKKDPIDNLKILEKSLKQQNVDEKQIVR